MTAIAPPAPPALNGSPLARRLLDARGPSYPGLGPASSPQDKADYVQRLLSDTEQDALNRYKRATQALLFSDGRQHLDWTKREKTWKELDPPEGRLHVTMNYLRPILRSRMQRMVSAELVWRTIPQGNDSESRDEATTCTNFLSARWAKQEMDALIRQALWFAFHCGCSALKSFWNPAIGPLTPATLIMPHPSGALHPPVDEQGAPNPMAYQPVMAEYPVDASGQPLHDEQGNPAPDEGPEVFRYRPGDVDTALRTIFNLRLNPDASGFEGADGFRWLLDSEVVPVSVVREKYGDRAKNVSTLQGTGSSSTGRTYERIIRSLAMTLGGQTSGLDGSSPKGGQLPDKDLCLLTEMWEPPSELVPQGRLIVTAGTELLFPQDGEPEGLPQGFVPFSPVYDERRPFDWGGRGCAEDMIAPQKVINRQWELELEEQARHGIGQWIGWDVAGVMDQITNATGAMIKVPANTHFANRSINDVVQRVPAPPMSPQRWRIMEEAKSALFDIGAFHEIQRGQVPPGLKSGVAVQYLQEAENAQLHDPVRNLKASCKMWGRHQLGIARWGYGANEARWLPVHRPDLGYLVESVKGSDLPDPDEVDIDLEGFRPISQAAQRADIKEMMDKGWMPPREGLMLMDLGRGIEGAFESQTRHYARARTENLSLERGDVVQQPIEGDLQHIPTAALGYALVHQDGTPYLLPTEDDHAVHVQLHDELALDDSKPWPIREMVLKHLAEHRAMAAQQAAAMQAQQAQASPQGEPTQEGAAQ